MSLHNFLSKEKELLLSFVSLLEQERDIMTSPSTQGENVIELANKKQDIVSELNLMENMRVSIQKKLGYPDGLTGARQAAEADNCTGLWDDIVNIAYRAKQLNESNGEFVRLKLEQNQRMVNFLRDANGESVYGPDGKTQRKKERGISSMA